MPLFYLVPEARNRKGLRAVFRYKQVLQTDYSSAFALTVETYQIEVLCLLLDLYSVCFSNFLKVIADDNRGTSEDGVKVSPPQKLSYCPNFDLLMLLLILVLLLILLLLLTTLQLELYKVPLI